MLQHTCRDRRVNSDSGPCLPPCRDRACFLPLARTTGESPVSISYLPLGTLGLRICTILLGLSNLGSGDLNSGLHVCIVNISAEVSPYSPLDEFLVLTWNSREFVTMYKVPHCL